MEKLIKGMSHLAFNVTDMARAIHFYCDILGLEKIFEIKIPENIAEILPGHPIVALAGKPGIAYLQIAPGEFLELFYPKPDTDLLSGGPNFERIGYAHLSLLVDDIQSAAARLKEQGIVLDTPVNLGPDKSWQFWIKDPDGNRIELMQYTDQSLQVVCGR
jgi:catechol 2,3-dioxygenase-like lactoylglutathione lyase family enzyme